MVKLAYPRTIENFLLKTSWLSVLMLHFAKDCDCFGLNSNFEQFAALRRLNGVFSNFASFRVLLFHWKVSRQLSRTDRCQSLKATAQLAR